MRAVFLDTVGMLAIWDVADQWHLAAEQVFAGLLQKTSRFYRRVMSLWNAAIPPRGGHTAEKFQNFVRSYYTTVWFSSPRPKK